MKRLAIIFAATLLLCVGTSAFGASERSATAARPAYDPFAMKRASQSPGTKEYDKFQQRQAIVKRLKTKTRPPSRPGNRSPHEPGNPYHDRDGDGVEDHGGHGPGNNPGNPPPFTPPGGGTGTNPGGNTPGDGNNGNNNGNGNGNGNGNSGRGAPTKKK